MRQTFKARIWCGSLTIWTRYVVRPPSPTLHSNRPRLSIVSSHLVTHSGNVCVNSEPYAELGGYSQPHTNFRLTSSTSISAHSPLEVMAMCTRGSSVAPGFASSVFGFTFEMVQQRLPRCVIDTVAFPVHYH